MDKAVLGGEYGDGKKNCTQSLEEKDIHRRMCSACHRRRMVLYLFYVHPRSDGHTAGSDFIVYAGPILPLNVIGDAEGIAADRSIHFSFEDVETSNHVVNVTDGYTLTNNTSGEKTIDIVYPFISGIAGSAKFTPTLSADGKDFRLELFIGDYTGGFTGEQGYMSNIDRAGSWKEYKSLLESGGYFKNALAKNRTLKTSQLPCIPFMTRASRRMHSTRHLR